MRKMFSLEEIIRGVNGELINNTGKSVFNSTVFVSGVSTDSRSIAEGELFIALTGDRFDGHDYLAEIRDKGAAAAVVSDRTKVPEGMIAVLVDDTAKALGTLARSYRYKLGAKVICVTGSVGKSSTREMIVKALEPSFKVHGTARNNNNEIGLPKTILEAPEDTEVLVLELGMRGRGQISYLSKIACPDIACITNVGYSHIEILGSREEILLAKNEITDGLVDGGILVVNGDDKYLFDHAVRSLTINNMVAGVFSGNEKESEVKTNCPVYISTRELEINDKGCDFDIRIRKCSEEKEMKGFHLNLFGIHNVRNALFAIFCTCCLSGDIEKAKAALEDYNQMNGRGAVTETKRYTVIDDAYNACPESMEASFYTMSIIGKSKRKVLALGCMLELGDYAPVLHETVGKSCAKYDFDRVYITGDNADDFIRGCHTQKLSFDVVKCKSVEEMDRRMSEYVRDDDIILFKGSNAFGLEKLAASYIERGNA